MRLLSFDRGRIGLAQGAGLFDLTARLGIADMRAALTRQPEIAAETAGAAPDLGLGEIRFGLPVPDPGRIFCIGVNYMNRNAEYGDATPPPRYPSVFMRSPLSFVGHGQALEIPPESAQLDYEGEIVLVIGRQGRRIPAARAMAHVAGLTIMNEGTIRDWVRHGKFNVTPGKNWDRSGSIGPWIETDLARLEPDDMKIETRVNGALRQSDSTASMAFPFGGIIEYLSTFATLMPGDLIATGTPTGAGARLDPPRWLRAGDLVEVRVAGVGTLSNPVREEPR